MSLFHDLCSILYDWLFSNWLQIAISIVAVAITYLAYRLLARQIARLERQGKLQEDISQELRRVIKWVAGLLILGIIIAQFGIDIGLIAGLLALSGGTIIGLASMNTIGNAIAGLIIMTSRPFKIGDRIYINGQFADVVAVDLIYTRMKTLDNVAVSVPNQSLLATEIDNYGKKTVVRRSCSVTVGYDMSSEHVEKALLEAAKTVKAVLQAPEPYVRITRFGDFAIEYTLYIFVNQIKRIPEIDANLKRTVLATSRRYGIDISTPHLIRNVEGGS